ncbi:hypothetical protein DMN91_005947 [Ooceraea biroi]|uniref:HYDIN/VesB/CFA65-like Ig-like domain-containing protein n=1 Tax=Ooceraea biroi TaxID=2015173 RepID=A0A3L8DMB6_OOCBI|nr:hypothetical protein DMN91_005947 [Ooceraea biroi]
MTETQRSTATCYPMIHDTAKIFAVLTGKSCHPESREHSILPSEYMKQMLMSCQERIGYLLKPDRSIDVRSLSDHCESQCFEVSPRILLFQQFVPGDVYNTTLTIRNVTKASRHLKISRHPDPFFSVEYNGSICRGMIAPGLVHVYNVRFSPMEKRDYEYCIAFVSDVEIPETAVKIPSSKTIAVRNVGDAPAIFNFCVNNPYFSVEPSKGMLSKGEMMQLTAKFLSEKSGDLEADLFLNYESGEKFCLTLRSSAINCTIQIERDSINMEETYLSLSRSKILTIHNRSDYIVRFQWMRFKDTDTDTQRREEYERLFQLVYDMEVVRHVNLVYYNICQPDIHELVCQRIYADEIASLKNENFRYNHTSFLLMPESGEIWPQSTADITVIFRATKVGEISNAAYLEVTGREDRIPLSLRGTGKGPVLYLNVITIDFKNIFLCSVHNYEIVAVNKGHICGTLIYKAKPTDFGGAINVTPSALTLNPDEYKSFNLSFSSNRKGDFVERVDFVIKESLEVVSLHVKGCIICPTLHFDKSTIDFGVTALGFSKKQQVCLRNLSLVPVSFNVSVMKDGDQAPITREEFARSEAKPSFPSNPREFTIDPHKGVVQAHSSLQLNVTYTANVARCGRSIIRVDMWDSDSDPVILPIWFCGVIPSLSINPAEISIRFCFINFPYSRSINVGNKSDLDGYFCIIPQMVSEDMPVIYSLSCYQGFLKARQSKTISVSIITKVLGRQTITLNMLTMGQQAPVAACSIICNGQGPVISVQPNYLNFGESESKKNSSWLVKPSSGEVGPNESAEIEVEIFLRDAGKYSGNIIVHILNSRSISINVVATGTGCSIIFEPQIFPIFNMGFLFSHQDQSLPITMKNLGTHSYQIIWSNVPEVRIQRNHCRSTNEVLTENWYIFGQIYGKGKRELVGMSTFKATFTKPQIAFDKRELTFRIDMYPEEDSQDTDELVVTNQSQLNLNVQLYVKSPFYLIKDQEVLVCKRKIVLMGGTTTIIPVKFLPNVNPDNPYSKSYSGVLWFKYYEHPNKDKIRCRGTVNFPNITLLCKDLIINCISGSSAEETLRMTNNGPVPAMYKFLWAGESIDIQRQVHNVGDIMDPSKLQINIGSQKSTPRLYRNRESSAVRENGNGTTKIFAASTSTLRVLQKSKLDELLGKIQSETLDETLEKLRSTFPSTTEMCLSCLKNPEILALMDPDFELKELLDDILDIVPHEGILVPYSSQRVRFIFRGSEPMQVKAVALCEIFQGPTEVVNVFASADNVRYSVDRQIIDFGQKLFGEQCQSSFILENHSGICLNYEIHERDLESDTEKSDSAISALTVEPNKGLLDPLSSMKIRIEFQPTVHGAFQIEFELQVANEDPLILIAKGVTSYPQSIPCVPRDDIFKQHSAELGHQRSNY